MAAGQSSVGTSRAALGKSLHSRNATDPSRMAPVRRGRQTTLLLQLGRQRVDVPEVQLSSPDGEEIAVASDDTDLLDDVVAGSAAAFGELYSRHARLVFAFCGRRSGNWSGAEDLASVVFLEAWRTCDRAFLVQGSLRAWLLGIAGNVMSTTWRSQRRHQAALARFAGRREAHESGSDDVATEAARLADNDLTGRLVRAALERLPRAQRRVCELCLLGELSAPEAAEVLGLAVSTVRSRLEDGRSQLRRLLRSRDIDRPSWLIGHQHSERPSGAAADTREAWTP